MLRSPPHTSAAPPRRGSPWHSRRSNLPPHENPAERGTASHTALPQRASCPHNFASSGCRRGDCNWTTGNRRWRDSCRGRSGSKTSLGRLVFSAPAQPALPRCFGSCSQDSARSNNNVTLRSPGTAHDHSSPHNKNVTHMHTPAISQFKPLLSLPSHASIFEPPHPLAFLPRTHTHTLIPHYQLERRFNNKCQCCRWCSTNEKDVQKTIAPMVWPRPVPSTLPCHQ